MQYNIWIIDPENDNVSIIESLVEGIDAARDAVAALTFDTHEHYDYALVGGRYDKRLAAKSNKLRKAKERAEKQTKETEAEAQALIADKPHIEIGKDTHISEHTGKPYVLYCINNRWLDDGVYNIEEDELVCAVQEYIDLLKATTK